MNITLEVETIFYYSYIGCHSVLFFVFIVLFYRTKEMDESQAMRAQFVYAIPWILSTLSFFSQMPHLGKDNVYHIPGYVLYIVFFICISSPFFLQHSRAVTLLDTVDYMAYKYDYDATLLKEQLDRYGFIFFPVEDFERYMATENASSSVDAKKCIEMYIEKLYVDYDIIARHETQYWDRKIFMTSLRKHSPRYNPYMEYSRVQELREIKARKLTSNTAIL